MYISLFSGEVLFSTILIPLVPVLYSIFTLYIINIQNNNILSWILTFLFVYFGMYLPFFIDMATTLAAAAQINANSIKNRKSKNNYKHND